MDPAWTGGKHCDRALADLAEPRIGGVCVCQTHGQVAEVGHDARAGLPGEALAVVGGGPPDAYAANVAVFVFVVGTHELTCEHVDGVAWVMRAEPVDCVDVHGTSLALSDDEKRVPQEPAHLGPRAKVGQPG